MKKIISFLIITGMLIVYAAAAHTQDKKVFVNKKGISSKQSGGKSTAVFPDVCNTPPTPSTGPVPVPYPNTSSSKDTQSGSKKIKLKSKKIKVENKGSIPRSEGDEAPTAETIQLKLRRQPATLKP
jgi:hypothetical protein